MKAALAGAFATLVGARNAAFDRGWLAAHGPAAPVVSVGNLAVGGRGKTPAVVAIGQELRRRNIPFDVLTRGYRRRTHELVFVASGDEPAVRTGDEPLLIARRLGVPVLVHANRLHAACAGEARFGSRLHLLDDGFQRRQMRRQFDLVIVTAGDLSDRMLPAGRLREPPASLGRADALLLLDVGDAAAATAAAKAHAAQAVRFFARKVATPVAGAPRRPVAFCGLAEPGSFWATLAGLGIEPAAQVAFRDHHRYDARDMERLRACARSAAADGYVTTEKDAMNLDPAARSALTPLSVVAIDLKIEGLERLVDLILARSGLGAAP